MTLVTPRISSLSMNGIGYSLQLLLEERPLFFWLMAGCGLRVSEVAALKVEHLDSSGGYIHIVNGNGDKQRASNSRRRSFREGNEDDKKLRALAHASPESVRDAIDTNITS